MKKKTIILIIGFFILLTIVLTNKSFNLIVKDSVKKYFFQVKYIKQIENLNKALRIEIEAKDQIIKNLEDELNQSNSFLSSIPEKLGFGIFYQVEKVNFNLNDNNFIFKKFTDDFIKVKKAGEAQSGSSYLDLHKDNVIIVSADGYFQYFNKLNLDDDNFKSKIIKSNLKEIIKYKEFYLNSKYGIKDLYIMNNYIYISYIKKVEEECFNTSILRAEMNYEKLLFKDYFSPTECIKSSIKWFQPHSSGGRMFKFKDKIIFSTGEFLDRSKAQDINSVFGKILMLDPNQKDKNNFEIISLGHRNVQGLFFDEINSKIISSEHGPQGGDEININDLKNDVNNYGWPISSYGEHYGFTERDDNQEVYKVAPLKKSHKQFGFIEPLKYFVPSIAISQIVKVDDDIILDDNKKLLIFGALGNNPSEGDMSIHFLFTDKNYMNIYNHNFYEINNRIRDMIILDKNKILLTLETSGTLGLLSLPNEIK
ncbi:MAG: PQQ-dependent sugar dehydrogenase [Pelagibacterales bacterium]|nr:PQQ-dependent sugar dehydrogenase [Pelagibacterales bacterium]